MKHDIYKLAEQYHLNESEQHMFQALLEAADQNMQYLKKHKISSYIKLQDHEKRKTRAYTEEIGKYYNMKTQIFEDELYYICHDGRELHHIRTEKKEQAGYTQNL